jgi:uncharacterized protein YkwD
MRRTLAGITVASAVVASVVACGPGTSNVPAQDVLNLINQKRAAGGCPAVAGDDKLRAAAERHAVDMRDKGVTGHTGSDGSTMGQRITDAGFSPLSLYGENMYIGGPGTSTAAATVDWWMGSPGHKANILNCQFTHIGVGVLYPSGKWYAVTDFGKH